MRYRQQLITVAILLWDVASSSTGDLLHRKRTITLELIVQRSAGKVVHEYILTHDAKGKNTPLSRFTPPRDFVENGVYPSPKPGLCIVTFATSKLEESWVINGSKRKTLLRFPHPIRAISWHSDGRYVAVTSSKMPDARGTTSILDLHSGREMAKLEGISTAIWSNQGASLIVSRMADARSAVTNYPRSREFVRISLTGQEKPLHGKSLEYSVGQTYLNAIKIWETSRRRPYNDAVGEIRFNPGLTAALILGRYRSRIDSPNGSPPTESMIDASRSPDTLLRSGREPIQVKRLAEEALVGWLGTRPLFNSAESTAVRNAREESRFAITPPLRGVHKILKWIWP